MRLTLVVPDLLWPRQLLSDTIFDLRLPAAETLLGRAEIRSIPQPGAYAWWLAAFGLAPPMPAAPLRLVDLGFEPEDRWWLCADPVHLRVEQQGMSFDDPEDLGLTDQEALELAASLSPVLAPLGCLQCDAPHAWHLALHDAPSAGIGSDEPPRHARAALPAGDEARAWRRALNEAQMLLHAHPVNQAREHAGRPTVNSLALWGAGRLPMPQNPGFDRMLADDAVIRGLAHSGGAEADPLTDALPRATGHWAVHWDRLVAPTRDQDALRWRDALADLESQWLAPLLDALNGGALQRCDLIALGAAGGAQVTLRARDRYKFWRRPRALESIAP